MKPPSTWRVILLLGRISLLRMHHRVFHSLRPVKKRPGKRQATAGKRKGSKAILLLASVMMLWTGAFASARVIGLLWHSLEQSSADGLQVRMSASRYEDLLQYHVRQELLQEGTRDPGSAEELRRIFRRELRRVDPESYFAELELTPAGERELKFYLEQYRKRGVDAFYTFDVERIFLPSTSRWPEAQDRPAMVRMLSLFLTLVAIFLFCTSLGNVGTGIGHIEWHLGWLFTFPVRTRSLFLARVLEYTLVQIGIWFTVFPFCASVYWSAGFGWPSLAIAALISLYVSLLLSCVRVLLESWLPRYLSVGSLRNVQATCSVIGLTLTAAVMYMAFGRRIPEWFVSLSEKLPEAFFWQPLALTLQPCVELRVVAILAAAAFGLLFLLAAVRGSAHAVRDGLIRNSSTLQGARGRAAKSTSLASGVLGKDLRLLLRDRNYFVQTLVVPVFVVGLQFLINRKLLEAVAGNGRHIATMAYALGVYVVMFGGFSALSVEGRGVWLLYTLPCEIAKILRRKALLWSTLGCFYLLVTYLVFARGASSMVLKSWPSLLMAVLGVWIYGFIATGMGALSTDPFAMDGKRRMSPGMVYTFLFLGSMYAYGIYAPSVWSKLALLTLCALLAYAIWQKVADHAPYLLDPTARPPARIALSDGLVAALAFFVVQGLTLILLISFGQSGEIGGPALTPADLPKDLQGSTQPVAAWQLTVAFLVAGVAVTLGCLLNFARRGVPGLWQSLGLGSNPGGLKLTAQLRFGVAAGLLGGLLGVGYLYLVLHWPLLQKWQASLLEFQGGNSLENLIWFSALAILAAPLFEEFIFRGLVFGGLRRSFPLPVAIFGSAAIFALVHPPISVPPVFVMGCLAAWVSHRSGRLWAAMLTHMVYNACVLVAGALLF